MEIEDYNPFLINFNDDSNGAGPAIFGSRQDDEEERILAPEIGDGTETISSDQEFGLTKKELPERDIINSIDSENSFVGNLEQSGNFFQNESNQEENKEKFSGQKNDLGPIREAVYLIETSRIRPNSQQPRKYFHDENLKELAESIREFGILQPLTVVRLEKKSDDFGAVEYELIAGERRWRAAQLLGLERVPAIVRQGMEEKQKLEVAIIENVQRQDLNSIETAKAYAKLADEFGLTQREIALRIGISREAVANALRLLQLPAEVQRAVAEGKISDSHARVILTIANPEKQRALLGEILSKHLTVREAESLARQADIVSSFSSPVAERPVSANPMETAIRRRLEELLGTKVNVKKQGERGKITINFFSEEELVGILEKILGEAKNSL